VLAAGEPGLETDTGRQKIGDGSTAWSSLTYRPALTDMPPSVLTVSSGTAPAIDSTTIADDRRLAYATATGKMIFRDPFFVDAAADFGVDFTCAVGGQIATNTTQLQAALAQALSLNVPLILPRLGTCVVSTTSGPLFVIGVQQATILGGGAGNVVTNSAVSGTRIYRASGTNPLVTITGTNDSTLRGHATIHDIELNGGGLAGDVFVHSRTNELDIVNVRCSNTLGRGMRGQQSWNNRFTRLFITTCGSQPTTYTGCSWATASNQITVVGTIPPNCDNLPVYGLGIPYGTVVSSVAGQVVTISANTTAQSSSIGTFTIGAFPALPLEGIGGDGLLGGSAVNHFSDCEWEGNNGPDIVLTGSPDGQAGPAAVTTFSGGKQERQIATNHSPVVDERYASTTRWAAFNISLGGAVASTTGTIVGGTLNSIAVTSGTGIAAGQQVTGPGAPASYNLKANSNVSSPGGGTLTTSLTILGAVPTFQLGVLSDTPAWVLGVYGGNALQVMSPGSSAITPGTTVTSISTSGSGVSAVTTIVLSAAPTVEMAGQDIVIGGMFVTASYTPGSTTVPLNVNAQSAHASQTYEFGPSRSRAYEKPLCGYAFGDTTFASVGMTSYAGADFIINQDCGTVAYAAMMAGPVAGGGVFHRIGVNVGADGVKVPIKGTQCVVPGAAQRMFYDERLNSNGTISGAAAVVFRKLSVDAFYVPDLGIVATTSASGTGAVVSLAATGITSPALPAGTQFQIAGDTNYPKITFTVTTMPAAGGPIAVTASPAVTTTIAAGQILVLPSQPTRVGNVSAWQMPKTIGPVGATISPTSTLVTSLRVPSDMAPGAPLVVRVTWSSPTTGANARFQLTAAQAGVNLNTAVPAVQNSVTAAASANAGFIVTSSVATDLFCFQSVSGAAFSPNSSLILTVSRVASNAGDTLTDVVNVESIDLVYQHA
jgi:hypothetical protein